MSKNFGTEDKYLGVKKPPQDSSPGDEASARKIIADYLDQVKARLPSDVASEVIPELRSHLLEQASEPSGRLNSTAAWEAVVAMGSPDIVAREFRRDKETTDIEKLQNFLDALAPPYRTWFWWIVIGIIIVDLALIAYIVSVVLLNMAVVPIPLLLPHVLMGVTAQVWVFAGIVIAYLIMLAFSHPHGPPIMEILRDLMQYEHEKEERVPRTQRRVKKRVKKFDELTGRGHLVGRAFGLIIASVIAVIFTFLLPNWVSSYPSFDLQILMWLAVIGVGQAGLTGIRIIIGRDSLTAARFLASIDVLFGLAGVWMISLFFYGPLSFPIPWWNPATTMWTLFHWKPYVMLISWLAPIIILLVLFAMVIEIIQVNIYIQPLYNGYMIDAEEFA
ncbi:MAG: hypothetical protein ACFE89_10385 [Candidatus Hodarchaeota archaeon]